jgi:hypothetical protein
MSKDIPEYKVNIVRHLLKSLGDRKCGDIFDDILEFYITLVKISKNINNNKDIEYVEFLIKEIRKDKNKKTLFKKLVIDSL